jgi:hypothetical protein
MYYYDKCGYVTKNYAIILWATMLGVVMTSVVGPRVAAPFPPL